MWTMLGLNMRFRCFRLLHSNEPAPVWLLRLSELGDEAALVVLVERLRQMQWAHLVALSGDPPFTQRLTGIEAVPRTDWRRVRRAIQQSDALILGGGSLLQDATSLRSLLYYLLLIHWGLRAHGRVWLVGQEWVRFGGA
jgi:polysaccharide pyruvyl transferase WcaK-like protein